MATGENSKIRYLVKTFMDMVEEVGESEDWQEADGWVGRMIIMDSRGDTECIYRVEEGKMVETDSPGPYVATVRMSQDTFLDIIDGAIHSRGEELFQRKYAQGHIVYFGERWIVDSERFKKAFRRMAKLDTGKALRVMME